MRFLKFIWLLFLFLLLILLEADNSWVHGQCLNDQRNLLLQLNQSLISLPPLSRSVVTFSSKRSSWNPNTDCCSSWDGVSCDRAGHVISLDLSSEFISGGLNKSNSLFNLQYLERLNLAFNSFISTTIPPDFDRLANLTYLNLSNSGFNGQIPIEISRMTRLVTLDLSTLFPGRTPLMLNNPDLGTLTRNLKELKVLLLDGVNISSQGSQWCQAISNSLPQLQVLSLANCYLSGPLDSSLLQLRSLYELRLNQNNISAEVPDFFGEFSNLTSLYLSSCELSGKFPERILQIPKLRSLYLSNNKLLQGSLPDFPTDGSLQKLVLSDTSFSGELPNSIGNLRVLSRLELENCRFNGSIPASITNLTRLQYLDLSANSFTGLIPSIGWSENLIQVDLSYNRLKGSIPSQWDKLSKLINLNLKNNSLNGTIPPALFTLPSLQKLVLTMNQFNGHIGEFYNGSPSLLDTLDLSINKLEGPIPNSIFQLSRLKIVILSSNNFNGTLSLDMFFQKFRNLSSLDLSSNRLSINSTGNNSTFFPQVGTLKLRSCNLKVFPLFLSSQSTLSYLDLSDNQIKGKIPNWIPMIGKGTLTYLNLSYNFLEDPELPLPENSFKWLAVLDLRSNMLQGKNLILPSSASFLDYSSNNFTSFFTNTSSYLSVAIFFSLSNNKLIGEIPTSICKAGYLQVLDLSNNSLSGLIPSCLGTIASLGVLNLRGNKFEGIMPQKFPITCNLKTLDLNGNKLVGQVATSLANCTMLEVLDLGNNQINGKFPSWLGSMSKLRVLVLRSNRFHGSIGNPEVNQTFPKLQIIDISSNRFAGTLSRECFSSLKGMMIDEEEARSYHKHMILGFGFLELTRLYYQDAVTVTSKGLEMELVKILTVFTCIDLSNNEFVGEIPDIIGNLKSLDVLNFSRNVFTGPIPSTLGNLTHLESLDLSRNKLTGEIPFQLAGLSFLSVLNLSFNELVGEIPSGRQFQTFTELSFLGNDGLCGLPLSKECIRKTNSLRKGSRSKAEAEWQFISTGLGFGGGMGMVYGPLMFWKKVRWWYIKHINRILVMIFPVGLVHMIYDDRRVDAEVSIEEELTDMTGDYDDEEEEEEEGFNGGHYCVICSKLDITRRRVIHNPNCNCHISPPNSS